MATRGWNNAVASEVAMKRAQKPITVPQVKRSKYAAKKTTVDGIVFHSAKEAKRYGELKLLEKAGQIRGLILQPRYGIYARPLGADPVKIADYYGDFQYYDDAGHTVVEDVKGFKTPMYRLKKKFVEAAYGIQIRET